MARKNKNNCLDLLKNALLGKIDSLLERALEYKIVKGGSLIKGHLYLSFNLKI